MVAFYGVVQDGIGGTLATVTEYMVDGSLRHVLLRKDRYYSLCLMSFFDVWLLYSFGCIIIPKQHKAD